MHQTLSCVRFIFLFKWVTLTLFSAAPLDLPFPAPFMALPGGEDGGENSPHFAYHPRDDITVIADASGTLFRRGSTSAFFQIQGIQRRSELELHAPGSFLGQTAHLNQLDIERTLISERIETRPEGIKQTFILRQRINGKGTIDLFIDMHGTCFVRETHPTHLLLEDGQGSSMLYDGLYVYDATGKTLPAEFVAADTARSFIIRVDDSEAVYPVEVDPLFRPFRSESPTGGTRPSDLIEMTEEGTVVKIDGDLVLVGVPGLDLQLTASTDGFNDSALNVGTSDFRTGKFGAMSAFLKSGLASIGLLESPRIDDVGAVYVFGLIDEAWELLDVLNDWNTAARYDRAKFRPTRLDGARFGETISIHGNSVMVGAPGIKSETWINLFVSKLKIAGPHTIGGLYFFDLPSIAYGFLRRGAVYGIRTENQSYDFVQGYDVTDYQETGRALDLDEDRAVVASGNQFDPFLVGGKFSGYGPCYLHHFRRNGTTWTKLPDPPQMVQLPGTVKHLHIAGDNVYVVEQVDGYTKLSMYPFPASGESFVPGVYHTWNTMEPVAFDGNDDRIILGFGQSNVVKIIELDNLQGDPGSLPIPESATLSGKHLALTGNLLACTIDLAGQETICLYSRDETTGAWSLIESTPSTHLQPIRSMDMDTSGLATLSYDSGSGKSPLHVLSLNRSISGTVTRADGSPVSNFAVVPVSEPTAIPAHGAQLFDGANFVPFEKGPWTINRAWGCGLFFSVNDAFPHLDTFSLEITFANVPPEMNGREFVANVSLPLQDYKWYGKDYYDYPGFGQGRGVIQNGTVTVNLWFLGGFSSFAQTNDISIVGEWEIRMGMTGPDRGWFNYATVTSANLILQEKDQFRFRYADTDSSGNFKIDGLPPGRYRVEPDSLYSWSRNYSGTTQTYDLRTTPIVTGAALEIVGAFSLSGVARTLNGQSIPYMPIELLDPDGTLVTGSRIFTGADGTYRIPNLVTGSHLFQTRDPWVRSNGTPYQELARITVPRYSSDNVSDIIVPPMLDRPQISVQTASGNAAPNTRIRVSGPYGYSHELTTDSNGQITLPGWNATHPYLYPGTYSLSGVDERLDWSATPTTFTLPTGEDSEGNANPLPALVAVGSELTLSTLKGGQIAAGTDVIAARIAGTATTQIEGVHGRNITSTTRYENALVVELGTISVSSQTWDKLTGIEVWHYGGLNELINGAITEDISDLTYELVLPGGRIVALSTPTLEYNLLGTRKMVPTEAVTGWPGGDYTLRLRYERPVFDKDIWNRWMLRLAVQRRTVDSVQIRKADTNGLAYFSDLPGGDYLFAPALLESGTTWKPANEVQAGEWIYPLDPQTVPSNATVTRSINFSELHTLSGSVRTTGLPVAGTRIQAIDTDTLEVLHETVSLADGSFQLNRVPSGRVTLIASQNGYAFPDPSPFAWNALQTDIQDIYFVGEFNSSISGTLTDGQGNGVPNAAITLRSVAKRFSGTAGPFQSRQWLEFEVPVDTDVQVESVAFHFHSNYANEAIYLIHPDGTAIKITDYNYGLGNRPITFVDGAPVASTQKLVYGPVRVAPSVPLSAFSGKPANGTWILRIYGVYPNEWGPFEIYDWGITIHPLTPGNASVNQQIYTDENGAFSAESLPPAFFEVIPESDRLIVAMDTNEFDLSRQSTASFTATAAQPTVTVTVTDGDGNAFENAVVYLSAGSFTDERLTDSSGTATITLPTITSGTIRAYVPDSHYGVPESATFDFASTANPSASFTLYPRNTPEVTVHPKSGPLTYPVSFAESQIDLFKGVDGTIAFDVAEGTSLAAGTTVIPWSFTPDDTLRYQPVSGTVSLEVEPADALITLEDLSRVYNGSPKEVTATTTPAGLPVSIVYPNGSVPVTAGSYPVTATINDPNYRASTSVTLEIAKAPVIFTSTSATNGIIERRIDEAAVLPEVTTQPADLSVNYSFVNAPGTAAYGPSSAIPDSIGNYILTLTHESENYSGSSTLSYSVVPQSVSISFPEADSSVVTRTYSGEAQAPILASTNPANVSLEYSYSGTANDGSAYGPSSLPPTLAGTYSVTATVTNPQLQGSATAQLVIERAAFVLSTDNIPSEITAGTLLDLDASLATNAGALRVSRHPASTVSYQILKDTVLWGAASGLPTKVIEVAAGYAGSGAALLPGGQLQIWGPGSLFQTFAHVEHIAAASIDGFGGTYVHWLNYDGSSSLTASTFTAIGVTTGSIPAGDRGSITAMAAGNQHLLFLNAAQELLYVANYTNGTSLDSALGSIPETIPTSGIRSIAAGELHAIVLDETGNLHLWGLNVSGQLNVPDTGSALPISIFAGSQTSVAILDDGRAMAWGGQTFTASPPAGRQWRQAAIGGLHFVALLDDAGQVTIIGTGPYQSKPAAFSDGELTEIVAGPNSVIGLIPTNAIEPTNPGTLQLLINHDDPHNLLPAEDVPLEVTVLPKAAQIILAEGDSATFAREFNGAPVSHPSIQTSPAGLNYSLSYSGTALDGTILSETANPPIAAGTYRVRVTLNDSVYAGYEDFALSVTKAAAQITVVDDVLWFDGTARFPTLTTEPEGLSVVITDAQGHSFTAVEPGSYPFVGVIDDPNYAGQIAGELTIAKASVSLSHTLPDTLLFGQSPVALGATASSSERVQFAVLSGPAVIDEEENLSATGVGPVVIELSVPASERFEAAFATHALTVLPASATVSLRVPEGAVYNGGVFAAEAQTTPAGLDVAILYNGTSNLPTGAGTYTVTATVSDPRYTGSASGSFSIAKAPVLFFWDNLQQYYDGTEKEPTVRIEPENIDLDVSFSGPYADGDPIYGGTYAYAVSASGPNHSGSSSANLTILPRPQVITMAPLGDMTYGDAPQPISASMDSGRDVRISVSGPAYLDDQDRLVPTGAGTVTVIAEEALPAERDYAPAAAVEQTVEITRATTDIIISLPYEPTYTGDPITATAYAAESGTLNQSEIQITYDGSSTPPINAGTYTIQAVGQNQRYSGSASATLVVARATASIAGSAIVTYTGEAQLPPVTTTPDLPYTLSWEGGAAPVNVGTHAFTVSVDEPNYMGSFNGNLIISQATATLSLESNSVNYTGEPISATITTNPAGIPLSIVFYGGPSYNTELGATVQNPGTFLLSATVTDPNYFGSLSGYFTIAPTAVSFSANNEGLVYTGMAQLPVVTTVPAGIALDWSLTREGQPVSHAVDAGTYSYTINASDSGFTGSYSDTFTIAKAPASISLTDLSQVYTGELMYPTASTVPAGLNVAFAFENPDSAPADPRDAGTYSVTASVTDPNYSGSITETFTISRAADTITWSDATGIDVWNPVALSASAGSGRPVFYTILGGSALLVDNTLTLTNADPVTIEAKVTTTGNYLDPSPVQRTFTPQFATASVTLGNLEQTYSGNPIAASAITDPEGLEVAILYDGNAPLPVEAGSYAVSAKVRSLGYLGATTGTLVVSPATADINISSPNVVYTGGAITPTVTTVPANLSIANVLTDGNGDPVLEAVNVGQYRLLSSIDERNYVGTASAVWNIIPAPASVSFDDAVDGTLSAPYTGSAISDPTVTTIPEGLAVEISYLNLQTGQALGTNTPTERGLYRVTARTSETNYSGSTSANLLLGERSVTFSVAELVNGQVSRLFNNAPVVLPAISSSPQGIPYKLRFYSEGADPATATEDFPVSTGRYVVLIEATEPFDTGSASFIVEIVPQNAVATFAPPADTSPGTAFGPLALVTSDCADYLSVEILSGPVIDTATILWGQSTPEEILNIPDSLALGITAAEVSYSQAAAVLSTGDWVYWGFYATGTRTAARDNPYTGVAIGNLSMAALKQDGTVETIITFSNPAEATVPASIQGSVVQLAAGDRFYVALLDDGSLAQWGTDSNENPLPAIPTIDPSLSWVAIDAAGNLATAISSDGRLHVWGDSPQPSALTPPNLEGRVFTDVRLTSTGGIGLSDVGDLHPWGNAPAGLPAFEAPIVDFAVSLQHAHAIDSAGKLYSWGDTGTYQQRTAPSETNGHPKRRVWASQNHVLLSYVDGFFRSYSQGEARLRYTITGCPDTADYSADQIFRVGEFAPTITFPEATAGTVSKTYTASPQGVAIQTIPEDLEYSVRYTGTTTAGETYGPTSSKPTDAGSYTVNVLSLDSFHQGSAVVALVIDRANQSISFSPNASFPITEQPLMEANASSGLPVAFSVISGPATLLNGLRLVCADNSAVVIEAQQTGNANFNPAPVVRRTLYPQRLASIEFVDTEPVYNGTAWDLPQVVTTPANLNVSFLYDGSASFPTWADSYSVSATIDEAHWYGSATADFLFQPDVRFTGTSFVYTGARSGPTFTIEPYFNTSKRYYRGETDIGHLAPFEVGDYRLVVTLLGFSRTYSQEFSITKEPAAITFSGSSAPLVVGQPGSLNAFSSSFTPVSFAVVAGEAILNGNTITPQAPGPLTVRATASGTANYETPDPVELTFYPTFDSVDISVTNTTKSYTGFGLSPDISLSEAIGYDITFDGGFSWPTQAGSYTYVVRALDTGKFGEASGTFTIAPKAETLNLATSVYPYTGNLIQPTVSLSRTGLSYSTSVTNGEGQVVDPINVGTYTLNAQITDPNYSGSLLATFTIEAAPVTFVFTEKVNDRIHRPLTGSPITPPLVDVSPADVEYSLEYRLASAGDDTWSATPPTERGAYMVRVSSANSNYTGSATADLILGARTLSFDVAESVAGVIESTYTGSPLPPPTITVSPAEAPFSILYTGTGTDGTSYSGTTPPTKSGTYTLLLSASDPLDVGSLSLSVVIAPADPIFTFTVPADLRIGQAFDPLSLIVGPCPSSVSVEVVSGPVNNRTAITWGNTQNNLTSLPSDLDNGFIAAHYGYDQGVAVTMDGRVISWGATDYTAAIAALAMPSVVDVASLGYDGQIALDENGNFHIWGNSWNPIKHVPADIQGLGIGVEAGYKVYIAHLSNDTLYEWGDTSRYTRTMPSILKDPSGPGIRDVDMEYDLAGAVDGTGRVHLWGNSWNSSVFTVPSAAESGVVRIAVSSTGAIALKEDGSLVLWGDAPNIPFDADIDGKATSIELAGSSPFNHAHAIRDDGVLVSWGANSYVNNSSLYPSIIKNGSVNVVGIVADGSNALAQYAGDTVSITGPGTLTLRFTVENCPNYTDKVFEESFRVGFDALEYNFPDASSGTITETYSGSPIVPTVTTTPENIALHFTYTGVTTAGATYGPTTAAPSETGTYSVNVSSDDPAWVGDESVQLVIAKAAQSLASAAQTEFLVGDVYALPVVSTAGLPVSYAVTSGTATISENLITFTNRGAVEVTASQPGNDSFTAAQDRVINFHVKEVATINFLNMEQPYDGTGRSASVRTIPEGLNVDLQYDGHVSLPVASGQYTVSATINESDWTGQATGTLTITRARPGISLEQLSTTYTGSVQAPQITTAPDGLSYSVEVTQNNQAVSPVNAGVYTVRVVIDSANYSADETLFYRIEPAPVSLTLSNLEHVYAFGNPVEPIISADSSLSQPIVQYFQNGVEKRPTDAGEYMVLVSEGNPNLIGFAEGTLSISTRSAGMSIDSGSATYSGAAILPAITTTPANLPLTFSFTKEGTGVSEMIEVGTYSFTATVNDLNYVGTTTGSFVIEPAILTATLADSVLTYTGSAVEPTVLTDPANIPLDIRYFEQSAIGPSPVAEPTLPGVYSIELTSLDPNYTVSTTQPALTYAIEAPQLAILSEPVGSASGSTLATQPVIEIRDAQGNRITSGVIASAEVTVGIVSGSNGTLSGTLTSTAVNGVAAFTDLALAGTVGHNYVLRFSGSNLAPIDSNHVTVTHGPATRLAILTEPVGGPSGNPLQTLPVVEIQDAQGNRVTSGTTTAYVSAAILSGSGGTLGGSATIPAISGIATYANLALAGLVNQVYVLRFSSDGLDPVDSTNITVTPGVASVATSLVTATPPSIAADGVSTASISIQLKDAQGANTDTLPMMDSISLATDYGTLLGSLVDEGNGLYTQTLRSSTLAQTATLTASIGTTPIDNQATVEFSPGAISVDVNGSSLSGSDLIRVADGAQATTITLQLRDVYGNAVRQSGVTVEFQSTLGTLSTPSAQTDGNGQVVVTLSSTVSGTARVSASISATGDILNGAPLEVLFEPGPATQLAIATHPQSDPLAKLLATQPVIEILDAYGNRVPTDNSTIVTVSLVSPAIGTLEGSLQRTAVNGLVAFNGLELQGQPAVDYTLRFTSEPALAAVDANPIRVYAFININGGTSATASPFTTTYGSNSAVQSFHVTGTNLAGPLTATAPQGFELSTDSVTFESSAVFNPLNGSSDGLLYVRLSKEAPAGEMYDGLSVSLSSTGAISRIIQTTAVGNAVARAQQSISGFAEFPILTTESPGIVLVAQATSGLAVTFSSSDEGVASISDNTVTVHGIGSAIITASQAGNQNFLPAPDLQQTLVVATDQQKWRFDNFGSLLNIGNAADEADFDGDGLANILEYALGTSPLNQERGPLRLIDSETFSVGEPVTIVQQSPPAYFGRFVRKLDSDKAGIQYLAEFSDDLVNWESVSTGLSVVATAGGFEVVEIPFPQTLSSGKAPKFFRVRVNQPVSATP